MKPWEKGNLTMALIKGLRMKPVIHPSGEPYVCRMCGTELLYRKRPYKYYGNRVTRKAEWCPICQKFRNDSTNTLQSRYYEGMRGRIKYA